MADVQEFSFFPVEFGRHGEVIQQIQVDALLASLANATDLLVLSHGWNNDMAEANELYKLLLARLREQWPAAPALAGRRYVVAGIFWPSKKFAERELIPGQVASIGGSAVSTADLKAELERLKGTFDNPAADQNLDDAKELVASLDDNTDGARNRFAALLQSLVQPADATSSEDAAQQFRTLAGDDLIERMRKQLPVTLHQAVQQQATSGQAAGSGHVSGLGGQLFGGIRDGALNLLNYTTYYQMKERAGKVGRDGLGPLLRRIKQQQPALRLHLVGHSFGGRLVTGAAAELNRAGGGQAQSMTLLQTAYSHYGLADRYDGTASGFFRSVVADRAVAGPIVISHTRNDSAVGTMYPLASRLAGQVASTLGDANDKYGGLGSNGAQKTPEASPGTLLAPGSTYAFQPGRIYNLKADEFIKGHSDIKNAAVAYAIVQAMSAS